LIEHTSCITLDTWFLKKSSFRVLLVMYTFLRINSWVWVGKRLKRCRNVFSTTLTISRISIIHFTNSCYEYIGNEESWLLCHFSSILSLTTLNPYIPKEFWYFVKALEILHRLRYNSNCFSSGRKKNAYTRNVTNKGHFIHYN